ncbi:hypothetical protein KK090_00965 [Curtobacterium flaccumfaciens pv. poinsettiae]|uniref:hypothetical protein n=1 Tax=Curtobacterium poinsettiae TaxID=159612 RepID=UPI001BE01BB8|nr:hypothetical protein [Curtobacterium flaccumfaciens]MBT1617818.1 hypothetical protein [Curtobacterium flaccumfaciens pv. poinsettiae]
MTTVRVSVPPSIARARWTPDDDTVALLDRSATALRTLDVHHGSRLAPLGSVLGRTEAVASSRIEDEPASIDDLARALVGIRANPGATAVVRAGGAVEHLVSAADSGIVTESSLLEAHRLLMRDDPVDGRSAGRYRDVQNWIGGGALADDPVLTEAHLGTLLTADQVERVTLDLVLAGVLRPVTRRRRDRAWVAPAVVAELEAFEQRVHAAVGGHERTAA